jgi:hypothetical protein
MVTVNNTHLEIEKGSSSRKETVEHVIEYVIVPRLERSITYMVEEGRPKLSLDLFSQEAEEGIPCLLVSHIYPEILLSTLDEKAQQLIKRTPTIWLSSQLGENCINPTDIGILVDRIVTFIENNEQSVVLLDGLEYLTVSNDFPKVVKAVSRINESVMQYDSIVIVPLEPRAFEINELALLERDMEII